MPLVALSFPISTMSYCILIPNYNHSFFIRDVLDELIQFQLPIIMINDGSELAATQLFDELQQEFTLLTVIHHEVNLGKGAAVQTGMKYAYEQGYQYGIQVDADGQHTLSDIEQLILMSQQHPNAVISGHPIYDSSVPTHRFIARYITHFWVYVETLSFKLIDTMCGFRVYPLAPCIQLFEQMPIGKRMDFDTEILVRLFWKSVEVQFMPTRVTYPENGTSHFKAVKDNILISWMHTRLVFGMLLRLPKLLWHKVS